MDNKKITFKTVDVVPDKFVAVINPDTNLKSHENILNWSTGIFGSKWDNGFPTLAIDLYENGSGAHQNLVNLRSTLLVGQNIQPEEEKDSAILDPFIKTRNKGGDNLKTVYEKACGDFALFDGCCIQVVFNREGKIPAGSVYFVPIADVRLAVPNKYNQVEFAYISKGWPYISNSIEQQKKESVKIRLWDPENWQKYPTQLLFIKKHSYKYYPVPSWTSAINWIFIAHEISEFHRSNIKSNFFLSSLISMYKGGMSQEQIEENSLELEKHYAGGHGRRVLLAYVDDMAQKPQVDSLSGNELDKVFDLLSKQAFQEIVTSHSAYDILAGAAGQGVDLGGDANKLLIATQAFYQLVVSSKQQIIVDAFNRIIVDVNGLPPITCITEPLRITPPIQQPTDLTEDERRAILFGLGPKTPGGNNADNTNEIPT